MAMDTPEGWALLFAAADVSHDMADYAVLADKEDDVAEAFSEVSRISGVPESKLLHPEERDSTMGQVEIISLGLLAGMTGVATMLVERHGPPTVVGGVSLGEYAALVTAGSLGLKDAIGLIHARTVKGKEPEAVGFAMVPSDIDWRFLRHQEGFTISVDYGSIQQGFARFLMLSGLRASLEAARQLGPVEIEVLEEDMADEAHHSQWRAHALKTVGDYLSTIALDGPSNGTKVATTLTTPAYVENGQDARSAILASEVTGLSVPKLIERFQSEEVTAVRVIGPFLRDLALGFGVPAEYYDRVWTRHSYA